MTQREEIKEVLLTFVTGLSKKQRDRVFIAKFTGINPATGKLDNYHEVLFKNQEKALEKAITEIERLITASNIKQVNKCIKTMQDILMENFHYRVMFGEIKNQAGELDINKAFVAYQELEPERTKFAQYIEKLQVSLKGQQ